jgi:hypothetical protein
MRRAGPSLAVVAATVLAVVVGSACLASPARAEVYTYVNEQGLPVFTNREPPKGKAGKQWRKLINYGPGKAMTVSGAQPSVQGSSFSSYAGCRNSRKDVVSARDRSPGRYTRYDAYIAAASRMFAVPEALIRAVIKVESDYDPNVVSCAGAKGLMQVMPYEITSERIENVFDPWQNIAAATRIFRRNANRWNGDLVKTIASYHAGAGAVKKYGGVPPYATTQFYVKAVLKQYERYKQLEVASK